VNLITHFNVRLAHIAAIGYHKSITAFNLAGAPLQPRVTALGPRSEEERSWHRPSASVVRAQRLQVHRTNRLDPSEQQIRRRARERKRDQRRREATQRLKQAALALTSES
jgi:hypothetical protein